MHNLRRELAASAPVVLLLLVAGALLLWSPGRSAEESHDLAAMSPGPLPAPEIFHSAASALRDGQASVADRRLRELESDFSNQEMLLPLFRGLYAYQAGQLATARDLLGSVSGESLEDWRLLVLAEIAEREETIVESMELLMELLERHPASVLRPGAYLQASRMELERGDPSQALRLIERGRQERLPVAQAAEIEALAWKAALLTGDLPLQIDTARRLLTQHPAEAERLGVRERFQVAPLSEPTWLLTPDELLERARALLARRQPEAAWQAVVAVPLETRDLAWSLVAAEVLIADRRGSEAFALLTGRASEDSTIEARIAWLRARAALDMGTVERSRRPLSADNRATMRRTGLQHLWRVVQLGADRALAAAALREIHRQMLEEERTDEAIQILYMLRQLDSSDHTGARFLWERGWQEYRKRNFSGAVGFWSELHSLYPDSGFVRPSEYWTGRAFEALGQRDRARETLGRIAQADTTDFYRRHALSRLAAMGTDVAATDPPSAELWPSDPRLERTRFLSDIGLDELALRELEATALEADLRAARALEGLIHGRLKNRRQSLAALRAAFPALGGPHQAGVPEEALHLFYPRDYETAVARFAASRGLSTDLVLAVIHQESGFDPEATSRAGARGLMQVMPATGREVARRLGLPYSLRRLYEPEYSIALGTSYLQQVFDIFDGQVELALAGYNGGPYRVRRLWRSSGGATDIDLFVESLNIPESRLYVKRVVTLADAYQQLRSGPERLGGQPEPGEVPVAAGP